MKRQKRLENWVAPNDELLPDFIIGGAMKSGTSTLHEILNTHPKIFIPEGEIHFFDIDNLLQHSDFNFFLKDKWVSQTMTAHPETLWNWYLNKFEGKQSYVKGEDSTTYLASKIAAERISIQKKAIKLIFLLRHPTKRAYSNYYHLLRSGRAVYNFEDTLRYSPNGILRRSLYKEQLNYYYQFISKENIKVVLFEDFIRNIRATVAEICDFVGVRFEDMPESVFATHSNKAMLPASIKLQRMKNYLMRNIGNTRYVNTLPVKPDISNSKLFLEKALNKFHSIVNPLIEKRPPPIKKATQAFLDDFFYKELEGIDELVGEDILSKWFMEETTVIADHKK